MLLYICMSVCAAGMLIGSLRCRRLARQQKDADIRKRWRNLAIYFACMSAACVLLVLIMLVR